MPAAANALFMKSYSNIARLLILVIRPSVKVVMQMIGAFDVAPL
jgi:hypothetical protein